MTRGLNGVKRRTLWSFVDFPAEPSPEFEEGALSRDPCGVVSNAIARARSCVKYPGGFHAGRADLRIAVQPLEGADWLCVLIYLKVS